MNLLKGLSMRSLLLDWTIVIVYHMVFRSIKFGSFKGSWMQTQGQFTVHLIIVTLPPYFENFTGDQLTLV